MRMSVWGGENFVTERPVEIEPVSPGVGRIVARSAMASRKAISRCFLPSLASRIASIAKAPALSW